MITKNNIKVFSQFAGYGGGEHALRKAGIDFDIVGFCEIDKQAICCYVLNFSKTARYGNVNFKIPPKNYGDVTKIDYNKLPKNVDLFIAGPPCQDWSKAGKRKGIKGKTGYLYKKIVPMMVSTQSKIGLIEQVDDFKLKYPNHYNKLIHDLKKAGYYVKSAILNSIDYGIPQNRPRIFIIAFKNKSLWKKFSFPEKEKLILSPKDLLDTYRDPKFIYSEIKTKTIRNYIKKGKRYGSCYKLCDINSHIHCLTASMGNGGGYEPKWEQDGKIIRMNPRECFRHMGLEPEIDINLNGISDSAQYRLVGNGWDVNLVSKIFKRI